YDLWAQQIAGGQWLGSEIFYQTPLYPYLLAVVFKLAGHSLDIVRVLQAVFGAAACALLGHAGRRFFDDRAGIIAALLLAFYPPAIFFDGLIQKSSLDIFLVTLVLALAAEFDTRRQWPWVAALGVAMGALVLNRENAAVWVPVISVWLLSLGSRARGVAWAALFVAAVFAVLLPVGIRNYKVGGEFVLSTSQLGPNFYIGNNPRASGSYESLVPGRGDAVYERADATALASKAEGRPLSPGEVSAYWVRQSFSHIREHPHQWARLLGKKVLLTINAAEIPDTESIAAYAESSALLRGLRWLDFGIVLPLAAFGAWTSRSQWRRLLVLYAMAASLALAVALFYVVARYRHPLVPIVLLFSGAGLSMLFDRQRVSTAKATTGRRARKTEPAPAPGRGRDLVPGLALAGCLAIVTHIPMKVVHDQTYVNLGGFYLRSGRAAEAIPVLRQAVSVDPGDPAAHLQLGLAYVEAGDAEGALAALTEAARLGPESGEAQGALGTTLREMDRAGEAIPHLRDAARLLPDSAVMHTNLGLALMETGKPAEAIVEHRRAVALTPDAASPHNNLALALHQSGDVRAAVPEYETALRIKPDDAEAHSNLGLALASLRDYAAAFRHFEEAVRLQPASYGVRMNYANALAEAGRTAEAKKQFEEAARLAR
ncbi:MAG TPA: tetratricopeptide repeat protein, partial [Vicinamibacterales bacterium]|nr:tetratricopeptide repeat protein [Vicinamibacterales bacterium]